MIKIVVKNVRDTCFGEYIGRPYQGHPGSPLANPFHIGRDGSRQEVIAKFRQWLWKQIAAGNEMVLAEGKRLMELAHRPEGVHLICWCSPLACHGDIIKAWLEWMNKEAV